MTGSIPNQLADMYGLPHNTQTLQGKQIVANINNMAADNARAAQSSGSSGSGVTANQNISTLMQVWKNTGKAPDGLQGYGVQPGTPYSASSSSGGSAAKVDPKESADNYYTIVSDLGTPGLTKDRAMQLAQANRSSLTDSDYNKLLAYINQNF
jgi:hypothetical protein